MKFFASACAIVAATLISGCATTQFGTDFNRKAASTLVPGKSTKADVTTAIGALQTPKVFTAKKDLGGKDLVNPLIVETSNYYFSDTAITTATPSERASRNLSVNFIDSTVARYLLSSTFPGESTDFDEKKVSQIAKGNTEAEVLALLGAPSGRAVYPFTKEIDGTSVTYFKVALNMSTGKILTKSFSVQFDANKKVVDFDLKIATE